MRVVSFNIHHGTVDRRGPVDPARLAATCAAFEADVIALQEVDVATLRTAGADLAHVVARECGMTHVFGPARRFLGGWYGNALLVRGRFDTWATTPLPRTPAWKRWQERRSLLEATAQVDGRSVSLAVTHLAVPAVIGLPQLACVAQRSATRDHPLVVLGDLNREPDEVAPFAAAAGLAVVEHGPGHPVRKPRLTIDHVLHSPDLVTTRVEVRRTEMSDHRALIVDLEPVAAT